MATSDGADTQVQDDGRRKWFGLAVLVIALSLVVVDGTVVGVAMPVIIGDLGLDLTDAQWVTSRYAVVFAALLLSFGRLGDRLGRRLVLIVGVASCSWGSCCGSGAATIPGGRPCWTCRCSPSRPSAGAMAQR